MGVTKSKVGSRLRKGRVCAERLDEGMIVDIFFYLNLVFVMGFEGSGGLGIRELGKEGLANCGHDCVCSRGGRENGYKDEIGKPEANFFRMDLCCILNISLVIIVSIGLGNWMTLTGA